MKNKVDISESENLRLKAEEHLQKKKSVSNKRLWSAEDLKLMHELEVHQIELEMQNEELLLAKENMELIKEKYIELFDFAPLGYFSLSTESKIIELNFSGARMLGKDRSYLSNKLFRLFVSEDTRTIFNLFFNKILNSNSKQVCDITLSVDGLDPMYARLTGILPEEREHCLLVVEDITYRVKAESIIQQQNQKLMELNSAKDKFYSIIAHDLKSPFLGFLGLTQDIIKNAGNISAQDLAQLGRTMYQSADNLFKLLQNLLEWSQFQSGSLNLEIKNIPLTSLITQNIDMIKELSDLKEIAIINMVTTPIHVYSDEKMINSVLLNLLSNAVKFTKKNGTVTIKALPAVNQMIEISIRDSGIGIPKDLIDKLFHVGEKTGRKGTLGELSSGLGLLLCKEFVEKNGGKIWLESTEGVGTTFYFTLRSKE